MKTNNLWSVRLLLAFSFLFLSSSYSQSDSLDDYNLAKKYLRAESIYQLAFEKIEAGNDGAVIADAVKDILQFSLSLKKDPEETIKRLDAALAKSNKNSETYGRFQLAKARLLMRKGDFDDAMKIFRIGVEKRWKDNAFQEMNQGLLENGREDLCAVDEYDRNTSDRYSQDLRDYYGIGSDLFYFFDRMQTMRSKHPDWTATNAVFPSLNVSAWRPFALSCAKALCLAADGKYTESLAILDPLEDQLKNALAPGDYDERKDLPLLRAVVLLTEGRDFEAMRKAFQTYIDRNRENPLKLINRANDIIYTILKSDNDKPKMVEVAGFFLQCDLISNEETRKQLPEDLVAGLHDKYQMGLAFCGRAQEAAQWAKKGMDLYYPQTFPGANCALNWAAHLSSEGKNEEAKTILYSIVKDTSYQVIIYWARLQLAYIERLYGNTDLALNHIQMIEEKVSPQDTGPAAVCLQQALNLKKELLADAKRR